MKFDFRSSLFYVGIVRVLQVTLILLIHSERSALKPFCPSYRDPKGANARNKALHTCSVLFQTFVHTIYILLDLVRFLPFKKSSSTNHVEMMFEMKMEVYVRDLLKLLADLTSTTVVRNLSCSCEYFSQRIIEYE